MTRLPRFQVLLRLDESTFAPVREHFQTRRRKAIRADHPSAWLHENEGWRCFYTDKGMMSARGTSKLVADISSKSRNGLLAETTEFADYVALLSVV